MPISISQLPKEVGPKFIERRFASREHYQILLAHFQKMGLEFHSDRAQVMIGVNVEDDYEKPSTTLPFVIGILPSFKSFNFEDEASHIAASIVGYRTETTATFIAAYVVVNHRPLGLGDFTLVEFDADGQLVETFVPIDELRCATPESLAEQMGQAPINPEQWDQDAGAPNITDTSTLAALAYNGMFDRYAVPLYPPGSVQRLLNDTPVTEKFSLAVRQRYSDTLASISFCTSTSTSSNICTSTSSSSFTVSKDKKLDK